MDKQHELLTTIQQKLLDVQRATRRITKVLLSQQDSLDAARAAARELETLLGSAPGPPPPTDQIDLSKVMWLDQDISSWPITTTFRGVNFSDNGLFLDYDVPASWPILNIGGDDVFANPWVIANVDGVWYAATFEWLRPAQHSKMITADNIGGHIKKAPLVNWKPVDGEEVYFGVSTLVRGSERTVNERSNFARVLWGS